MNEPVSQQEAQFNIGLSTAYEIRNLLNECNLLARQGVFTEWYNTLLIVNREICAEKKYPKHKDSIRKALSEASDALGKWTGNASRENSRLVYHKMNELETEIRMTIKDCGLGMPDKEDDDGL